MTFFNKKQEVELETCCRLFYENVILNCVVNGLDVNVIIFETLKNSLIAVDQNFANIDSQKFNYEIIVLQFELFALAWLHPFGNKLAVDQSTFTKNYLHEKKRDDIWDAMEPYNQAIARSSTFGKTSKNALDRVCLGTVFKTRADLFDQFYKKGYDPECIARALNRLFSDKAWKKGIAAGLLMLAFCDRLGFDQNFQPSKEAHSRWFIEINNFYENDKKSLSKYKIKTPQEPLITMQQEMRKDSEWSVIDGELCRVTEFIPMALVQNGKVLALNLTEPYASVSLECKKVPYAIKGFICHKMDFKHLWAAFKERPLGQNEEVIIVWSMKRLKSYAKIFPLLMPRLYVMVCPKGAFELMVDPSWKPELTGEARWNAERPIVRWKPEVMK